MSRQAKSSSVKYSLNRQGSFVIENYNQARPLSNFFPGIAGIWGIPMWVFYVNRGQGIASFGIESKDKAMLEFQPANKAYRLVSLQGFRTFIKVREDRKTSFWEPFAINLEGTQFPKKQKMLITAHDLTLTETNEELGLSIEVNYFTLPEESYPALVRYVRIKNLNKQKHYQIELMDGLPVFVPFGWKDHSMKHLSRTVEAWVKVHHVEQKTPYYHLNVEVSDTPQVKYIKEGNFFFSFDPCHPTQLLPPIVEASCVFGQAYDFVNPQEFLNESFQLPEKQFFSNQTPCAMVYDQFDLSANGEKEIVSLFGYAYTVEQLQKIVQQVTEPKFISRKAQRNQAIIDEIKNYTLTQSTSVAFNLYAQQTFLDNILRGGIPITTQTSDGEVTFNVYSRKHGDLERDYNYFILTPTFYSQGNGNYRDVNQNRRNDVWFHTDVKDTHIINFLNLIQADGYNPLIVKGTSFRPVSLKDLDHLLDNTVSDEGRTPLKEFMKEGFLPGELLQFIEENKIPLIISVDEFLGRTLETCHKQELAEHGDGFWSDHWSYNLDLIESYLRLYPEDLKGLLIERKVFSFYHNNHYVLPRDQRYILTANGVRQYASVYDASLEIDVGHTHGQLRTHEGQGPIYQTNLLGKLLCVITNKIASLDPSGIGIEMEADKPNWYDALNGLPGLLGSSVCETFELKRLSLFLLNAFKQVKLEDAHGCTLFEELYTFLIGLTHLLSCEADPLSYWMKANDIKEHYRQRIRRGIQGEEKQISVLEIKHFLERVIKKTDQATKDARNQQGFLSTYFYHEVTEYKPIDKRQKDRNIFVRPMKFRLHHLPLFLEGYVHALRISENTQESRQLYREIRQSRLFDRKLKMYKVNEDLSQETEEIGRARIFPSGWLENESVWLHMEYKWMLELLHCGLYEEFYENFNHVLIPFQKPSLYGRSILENSSFIVSSVHENMSLHGQGFVARLSGSTAEFLHIWLYINLGKEPFTLNAQGGLVLTFGPILPGWLFVKEKTTFPFFTSQRVWEKIEVPKNTYAFNLLGSTLVVYHNPQRKDTFGHDQARIEEITLTYPSSKRPVVVSGPSLVAPYSEDIRNGHVERIDIQLK